MPTYAYRCHTCSGEFEVSRPMSESGAAATCPQGHTETVKLLTAITLGGRAAGAGSAAGGGCCGGACGCG